MKLTYLISDSEAKDRFLKIQLPDGVTRSDVGTYEVDGDTQYLVSLSTEGSALSDARTLATVRRSVDTDTHARLLEDGVSFKFATVLYRHFAEYEHNLRYAITLAISAEYKRSDDKLVETLEKLVETLENLSLNDLGDRLFRDRSFQSKVREWVKDSFTKDQLVASIDGIEERTIWSELFEGEALSSVRENYAPLCDMRNKVMHHRLIKEEEYDDARNMLSASNHELERYIQRVLSDANYPKEHAERAANARSIWETIDRFEQVSQMWTDRYREICEAIAPMLKMSETLKSQQLSDAVQIPSIAFDEASKFRDQIEKHIGNIVSKVVSEPVSNIGGITGLGTLNLTLFAEKPEGSEEDAD